MQKKNKTFIFKISSLFFSIFLVFFSIEIYVREIVDDGLNLDIEMLKYANSLKIISKNEAVGLEHKKNIEKKTNERQYKIKFTRV